MTMYATRATFSWIRDTIMITLLFGCSSVAQDVNSNQNPVTNPTDPAATQGPDYQAGHALVVAPNNRFLFSERYSRPGATDDDGKIGAYRVAFVETIDTATEVPRAAPQRTRTVVVAKCSELPVIVQGSDGDVVVSLIRRYDSFRVEPDLRKTPSEPKPLEGREVWVQRSRNVNPMILTLGDSERPLRREEFHFASDQQIFVPDLADALPDTQIKVGQSWRIQPLGTQTLLGGRVTGGELTGQLISVEPVEGNPSRVRAYFKVSGHVRLNASTAAVNAEAEFEFPTPDPASLTGQPTSPTAITTGNKIVARGAIVRLALSQVETVGTFIDGQRGKTTRTRQIILERRLGLTGVAPIDPPSEPPTPTRNNSWVRTFDSTGRFSFDHPQAFTPGPAIPEHDGAHLMRATEAGPDDLYVAFRPKERTDVDDLSRRMVASSSTNGFKILRGPSGWLPEEQWGGRRVYRMELGLTPSVPPPANAPRVQAALELYLVRFPQDASAYLQALTAQPDPSEFQQETAEIVRTFRIDDQAISATPTAPTSTTPARAPNPAATDSPPPIPPSTTP
jgi:hypothetical protein